MTATEDLPFFVDLWADDGLAVERELARAGSLSIARAAFDTAAVSFPGRMITLHGPGAFELRSTIEARRPARRTRVMMR